LRPEKTCPQCKVDFRCRRVVQIYCSARCTHRAQTVRVTEKERAERAARPEIVKMCPQCGEAFVFLGKGRREKYCSLSCFRAAKQKRIRDRRADSGQCVRCGRRKALPLLAHCGPCAAYNSERGRVYALKHPDKARQHTRRRRAIKLGASEHYTDVDLIERAALLSTGGKARCFYCETPTDPTQWPDHFFPLTGWRNDAPVNMVPCCRTCNLSKHDKDPLSFMERRLRLGRPLGHFAMLALRRLREGPATPEELFAAITAGPSPRATAARHR
jgi:hypothetical protein